MALILYFDFKEPKIDKWTERQIRQTHPKTDSQTDQWPERQKRQIDRQTDGRADSQLNGQIKRELNGQTDFNRLIDRQTKILTDRPPDRQTSERSHRFKERRNK